MVRDPGLVIGIREPCRLGSLRHGRLGSLRYDAAATCVAQGSEASVVNVDVVGLIIGIPIDGVV